MRIEYRTGDFLAGPEPVACHGCNAQGRMGGSVATQVRERHPAAFDAYLRTHRTEGLRTGRIVWARGDGRIVANAVTQKFYGNSAKTGIVYLDYEALATVVATLDRASAGIEADGIRVPPFASVAFPLIGAGLAGGSWDRIARIIEHGSTRFAPVVYTMDGRVPSDRPHMGAGAGAGA